MGASIGSLLENSLAETATLIITNILMFLMPLMVGIHFGIAFIRHLWKGERLDLSQPLSYVLLYFLALSYNQWMSLADASVNYIEKTISADAKLKPMEWLAADMQAKFGMSEEELIAVGKFRMKATRHPEADSGSKEQYLAEGMRKVMEDKNYKYREETSAGNSFDLLSFNLFAIIENAITDGLTGVIRAIIFVISGILASILYIIGPLAILFETIPFVGNGTLKHWFTSWLQVKCWLVTCSVIDLLIDEFTNVAIKDTTHRSNVETMIGVDAAMFLTVANLSFIIMYIMVPKITSYYVRGAGSSIWSAAIGGATTAIAVGGATMTGGASLAASQGMAGLSNGMASMGSLANKTASGLRSINNDND